MERCAGVGRRGRGGVGAGVEVRGSGRRRGGVGAGVGVNVG